MHDRLSMVVAVEKRQAQGQGRTIWAQFGLILRNLGITIWAK